MAMMPPRRRRQRDEQPARDDEDEEVEERDLVRGHAGRRDERDDLRRDRAHHVDVEDEIVLFARLFVDLPAFAEHRARTLP